MKKLNAKSVVTIIAVSALLVVIIYLSLFIYFYKSISKYSDRVYPNVFIRDKDVSTMNKQDLDKTILEIQNNIESQKITFTESDNKYEYSFKDVGISINKDKLSNEVLSYSHNSNYFEKIDIVFNNHKKVFNYKFDYVKDSVYKFLNNLKSKIDRKASNGKLVMDSKRNLTYKKAISSFELNVDETYEEIVKALNTSSDKYEVKLRGKQQKGVESDLQVINTKVSSFTTKFNDKVSRAKNLQNAAKNLDGVILKPGEIFSFYKFAGPYNKKGYVYYDGVMGNGVCQVASTIYNTQLLAGLKTIERYPHAYKMIYVKGGLDATVAANSRGSTVNFRFKNTYKYPIYISAYVNGGSLTIEFWSNDKAKEGKTYETESVQIAPKGYKTYLITYKDGKKISRDYLTTTWYPK